MEHSSGRFQNLLASLTPTTAPQRVDILEAPCILATFCYKCWCVLQMCFVLWPPCMFFWASRVEVESPYLGQVAPSLPAAPTPTTASHRVNNLETPYNFADFAAFADYGRPLLCYGSAGGAHATRSGAYATNSACACRHPLCLPGWWSSECELEHESPSNTWIDRRWPSKKLWATFSFW